MQAEWTATPAQQQTLERLIAANEGGVLVRTLPDGSLEVLTEQRGALGRHVLGIGGSSALVESRPPTWRWWGAPIICYLGCAMFIGSVIGLGVQDEGGDARWWTIVPMWIGFAGVWVGLALTPGPHQLTERGERWAKVMIPHQ
jgi:hypothetical protein